MRNGNQSQVSCWNENRNQVSCRRAYSQRRNERHGGGGGGGGDDENTWSSDVPSFCADWSGSQSGSCFVETWGRCGADGGDGDGGCGGRVPGESLHTHLPRQWPLQESPTHGEQSDAL